MSRCLSCLEPIAPPAEYHPACIRRLFGTSHVPEIDLELAKLHTVALAMVGHTSMSGVQRKISVRLAPDGGHLRVATEGGQYILKPQAQTFPALPENEHLTMRLAGQVGIEIPPCGLFRLRDGSLAFLSKRFDRLEDGTKLLQEDFCQLDQRSPKERYGGSAELCGRLLLQYASEPIIETFKLFRQMVFAWWIGNGDMHLKNLSLLRETIGTYRLSPAYDLLSTRLVIPGDLLALSVDGNKKNVTRRQWLTLAQAFKVPDRAAKHVLDEIASSLPRISPLVEGSYLPPEMKDDYQKLIRTRAWSLLGRKPTHRS